MENLNKMEIISFFISHPILWAKIIGASVGSSIAVVFQPNGDNNRRLLARFIIGAVLGIIFSPLLLDTLKMPHTWDYWLAASSFIGAVGVLVLQVIFSRKIHQALEENVADKLK